MSAEFDYTKLFKWLTIIEWVIISIVFERSKYSVYLKTIQRTLNVTLSYNK